MHADDILSPETYRIIFSLWPDFFCLADRDGIFLDVNPACERVLGFCREEMIGRSWEDFIHPDDVEKTRAQVDQQLTGKEVLSFTNRYRTKSGEYLYIQWQGVVTDSQCLIGIGRDITKDVRRSELLAKVAQNERSSLCATLHDGISQQLFGLRMIASQLRSALEKHDSELACRAALMEQVIQETMRSTKNVMEGLAPCVKHDGRLWIALERFCERIGNLYNVHCVFEVPEIHIDPDVANQLCLITQEAVMNAVRHASASRIDVSMKQHEEGFSICVEDNGIGIPAKRTTSGFGLSIMQDRAHVIGATLEIQANPGGGTRVTCMVDMPKELRRMPDVSTTCDSSSPPVS